jgi:putative membrane protein
MALADTLAAVNAALNALSGLALITGWALIRQGRRDAHRNAMLGAFGISAVFLVCYLARVALSGTHPYPDGAPFRAFYLAMLASHVTLAASVPFFAVGAIVFAFKGNFARHKALVRWGLPIWLYVSVTGVGVYLMLYHVAGVSTAAG